MENQNKGKWRIEINSRRYGKYAYIIRAEDGIYNVWLADGWIFRQCKNFSAAEKWIKKVVM